MNNETADIGKMVGGGRSHLKILNNLSSDSKSFSDLLEVKNLTNSGLLKHLGMLKMLKRLNYIEKKEDVDRSLLTRS